MISGDNRSQTKFVCCIAWKGLSILLEVSGECHGCAQIASSKSFRLGSVLEHTLYVNGLYKRLHSLHAAYVTVTV